MTKNTQSFPCPWCDDLDGNTSEERMIRHVQYKYPEKPDAALSADQWRGLEEADGIRFRDFDAEVAIGFGHDRDGHGRGLNIAEQRKDRESESVSLFLAPSVRALIAVANAALPDSDPRKFTRATIAMLRRKADVFHPTPESPMLGRMRDTELDAFADALESYLPPER